MTIEFGTQDLRRVGEHWEWQGGLGWLHPVGTSFRIFTFREHGTPSQGPRSVTPGKTRQKADKEGLGTSESQQLQQTR